MGQSSSSCALLGSQLGADGEEEAQALFTVEFFSQRNQPRDQLLRDLRTEEGHPKQAEIWSFIKSTNGPETD